MLGYHGDLVLSSETQRASLTKSHGASYWAGSFDMLEGMSGGPLLSSDNQIVGINSFANSFPHTPFLDLHRAYFDRIDSHQYADIQQWAHNDMILL
jgi:hypothetical protein